VTARVPGLPQVGLSAGPGFREIHGRLAKATAAGERVMTCWNGYRKCAISRSGADSGIPGRVKFDQIRFAYEAGQPVLEDVNLAIEPGHLVAIVGRRAAESPSGQPLLRLYDRSRAGC